MNQPTHKRRIQVIKPLFQLKLVATFLGLSVAILAIQMGLLALDLHALSKVLPAGHELTEEIPGVLARSVIFSAGLGLPIMIAVGLLITHSVAGPVHRMERHLEGVIDGELEGPCRLRRSDSFQELAALINEALEAERERGRGPAPRVTHHGPQLDEPVPAPVPAHDDEPVRRAG